MRVTAKSDYALRALVELAAAQRENPGGEPRENPVSADELGRLGHPHGFLQAILSDLRRAGVASGGQDRRLVPGARRRRSPSPTCCAVDGPGQRLRRPPESVVYNERAGSLQHVGCLLVALRRVMDAVTIADLAAGQLRRKKQPTLDSDAWEPR